MLAVTRVMALLILTILLTLGFSPVFSPVFSPGVALSASSIAIHDQWMREAPPASEVGAVYMRISNTGDEDDALVGVATPAAEFVEIHSSTVDERGVARMERAESVAVPRGGVLRFEPGGYHLMLINLKAPLEEGDAFEMELEFEKAGSIKIQVPVKKDGMGEGQMKHHNPGDSE